MNRIARWLIRFYQKAISPYMLPRCRYIPTCSAYALQAFEGFGFLRGLILAAWRVLRCNPFSKGGYDPIPHRFLWKYNSLMEDK
jgi:putative membrane protein insertion efficiency factor